MFHIDSKTSQTTRKKSWSKADVFHDELMINLFCLHCSYSLFILFLLSQVLSLAQNPIPSYTYSLKTQLGSHFLKKQQNKTKQRNLPDFLLISSIIWIRCPHTCFHNTIDTSPSLKMLQLSEKKVSPTKLSSLNQYHSGCSTFYE